jgi:hypothetical protein
MHHWEGSNGTPQLLVCADHVKILGESMHAVKKNTEALVVASKETGEAVFETSMQDKITT